MPTENNGERVHRLVQDSDVLTLATHMHTSLCWRPHNNHGCRWYSDPRRTTADLVWYSDSHMRWLFNAEDAVIEHDVSARTLLMLIKVYENVFRKYEAR